MCFDMYKIRICYYMHGVNRDDFGMMEDENETLGCGKGGDTKPLPVHVRYALIFLLQ